MHRKYETYSSSLSSENIGIEYPLPMAAAAGEPYGGLVEEYPESVPNGESSPQGLVR